MEGNCKICNKKFDTLDERCKIDYYYKTKKIKLTCETCLKKLKKDIRKLKRKKRKAKKNEASKTNN